MSDDMNRWMTPAQRQDLAEAPLRHEIGKLRRERDEAKAGRAKAWEALRLALADAERLEAERDRLREALEGLAGEVRRLPSEAFGYSSYGSVRDFLLAESEKALAATEDET
jgi:hypothetical protein